MAYLGHREGPPLSGVLERYKPVLMGLTLQEGSGSYRIPEKVIDNLIQLEILEESEGKVVPITIPTGYGEKAGEYHYRRFDYTTKSGIEFFYELTEAEIGLLGDGFKKQEKEMKSPGQLAAERAWNREVKESGEFPLFG